jgi:hypothetical protein
VSKHPTSHKVLATARCEEILQEFRAFVSGIDRNSKEGQKQLNKRLRELSNCCPLRTTLSFAELLCILGDSTSGGETLAGCIAYPDLARERYYLLKSIWSEATSGCFWNSEDDYDAVGLSLKKYLPCISFLYARKIHMDRWKLSIEEALRQHMLVEWPLDEAFASFLPSCWLRDTPWLMSHISRVDDKGLSLSYLVREEHLLGRTEVLNFMKQCPQSHFCLGRAKLPAEWYGDKQLAVDALQAGIRVIDSISPSLQYDPDVLMEAAGEGPQFFFTKVGSEYRSDLTLACHAAKHAAKHPRVDILIAVNEDLWSSRQLQACSNQNFFRCCVCTKW